MVESTFDRNDKIVLTLMALGALSPFILIGISDLLELLG